MSIRSADLPASLQRRIACVKVKSVKHLHELMGIDHIADAGKMVGESVTIVLPLPAKSLSPNARVHHMVLARAKAAHLKRAAWVTFEALHGDTPKWQSATIQPTFYHAQRRRRDQTNLLGGLKAYEDGLVLAGLLADDEGVIWLPAIKLIDRDNPRVELTITNTTARQAGEQS